MGTERMRTALACAAAALLATGAASLRGAETRADARTTVLVTFDTAKLGPAAACDGAFSLAGGQVRVRPWLGEEGDTADGASFRMRTEHDATTAQAAGLGHARRCSLDKGLIVEAIGPGEGVLRAGMKPGAWEVPLATLRERRSMDFLDGGVRAQWIPDATPLTGDAAEEEYPSAAALPDGTLAVAYVAWDGRGDRVELQAGGKTRTVTPHPGDYLDPRCAVDGQGRTWVVWAAGDGRQWDLWAESDGKVRQLTRSAANDFWPRLARDARGRLWLAWQTVSDDLHYDVMLARLESGGLRDPVNVSRHPADDWEPSICATPDDRIVVAWDTYRNGSYDVYLREFPAADAARVPGGAMPVAAGAMREAHATVAADSRGRVWIAWDVGNADWGKHPAPRATLHQSREVDVACLAGGRLLRPSARLMDAVPAGARRFVEYPQVAVDGEDRVWVFFRMENQVLPFWKSAKAGRLQSYGLWHVFASQLDGAAWTAPLLLADSNGRQDMRVDATRDGAGHLQVVYAGDGRTRVLPYVPVAADVFRASLAGLERPGRPAELVDAPDLGPIAPVPPDPELQPLPRRWSVGGGNYRMVIGDTHRHTDISRCSNGYDGSLQDAYRYALDAAGLDWLAISDHDQDILRHRADRIARPRQEYDWWRSQKTCDLYTIPGRFVALYGYEHGGSYAARGGHKNVIEEARGRPVVEEDAPHALFAALGDSGALAIPHQLADGAARMDWDRWNDRFERVAEIFQARGSYEFEGCPRSAEIFTPGHSVWDALARGVRIGIVASSDHGQTHQARAGVYVDDTPEGFTRKGILDALRARRAFGATVAVSVRLAAGGDPMGREITVDAAPAIDCSVTAPEDIAQCDLVRDGRFVYAVRPKAREAAFQYRDLDLKPGQSSYYYLRARIGANDFAWSSPLWIRRSP